MATKINTITRKWPIWIASEFSYILFTMAVASVNSKTLFLSRFEKFVYTAGTTGCFSICKLVPLSETTLVSDCRILGIENKLNQHVEQKLITGPSRWVGISRSENDFCHLSSINICWKAYDMPKYEWTITEAMNVIKITVFMNIVKALSFLSALAVFGQFAFVAIRIRHAKVRVLFHSSNERHKNKRIDEEDPRIIFSNFNLRPSPIAHNMVTICATVTICEVIKR